MDTYILFFFFVARGDTFFLSSCSLQELRSSKNRRVSNDGRGVDRERKQRTPTRIKCYLGRTVVSFWGGGGAENGGRRAA